MKAELTDEDRAALDATVDDMMAHPEKIAEIGSWELIYLAGLRAGRERQREEDARICDEQAEYWSHRTSMSAASAEQMASNLAAAIRKSAEPPKGEHG